MESDRSCDQYDEMERRARSRIARFKFEEIGTLAWGLGMADSIPKGIELARQASLRNDSTGQS
jgi:hypothetical protein